METQNNNLSEVENEREETSQTNAERGAALAAQATADPLGGTDEGFLGRVKTGVLGKFLGTRADEFEKFAASENERNNARVEFENYTQKLANSSQELDALRHHVAAALDVDLAKSIYHSVKNSGKIFYYVVNDLIICGNFIAQQFGPKVLELAEKEHAELERQFAEFKSVKKKLLKGLKLI